MDKIFFDLTDKQAPIKHFEIPPVERKAGGLPDIATEKIRMFIGSNPVAFNLKELYKKSNKQIPPEIQIFKSYNVFILNHTVGVIQEGGWEKVKQIGYRMRFAPDIEITVLDVMPQTKFIKLVEGNLNFEADLNLNGELSVPDEVSSLLNKIEGVGLGGKLKVAASSTVVGRLNFSVITSEVQSIGKGNNYSEWVFNRVDKPLFGDDIEMFQVILVDRFIEELSFEASIYSTISTWNLLPSRRQSEWVKIICKL